MDWPIILHHASKYLLVLGVGAGLSLVFTRWMIALAPRLGLMDMPDARRIHRTPIPRAGGVAVFLAFHLALLIYFYAFPEEEFTARAMNWWVSFAPASLVLFLAGLWDDSRGMRPLTKLGWQVAAATLLFIFSTDHRVMLLGYELSPWLNYIVTVLWVLAIVNAMNLIDGMDGLCSGLALISALGLAVSFYLREMPGRAVITFTLIGALAGFLRYNFNPARIFLGDTGSMFLGLTLSTLALQSNGKTTLLVTMGMPIVAAGVPLIDTMLAIWRRSMRQQIAKMSGTSATAIMGADKDHLHHRLLASGWTQRKVTLMLYLLNATMVVLGLCLMLRTAESGSQSSAAATGVFLVLFVALVYVVVRHVVHVEVWDTGRLLFQGIKQPGRALLKPFLLPTWDIGVLASALIFALIVSGRKIGDIEPREWIAVLSTWIGPVMLSLAFSQTYLRVWSKANFRDFLILFCALAFGCMLSYIAITMIYSEEALFGLRVSLIAFLLAQPGIIGGRALVPIMREWMLASAAQVSKGGEYRRQRVLLYGAGERSGLYLRELRIVNPDEMARVNVLGFLDDNAFLRRRLVHGVPVLGTLDELARLVGELEVDEVIVTTDLMPANEARLVDIARTMGIPVRRWLTTMPVVYEPEPVNLDRLAVPPDPEKNAPMAAAQPNITTRRV